jgi:hypothetical protein
MNDDDCANEDDCADEEFEDSAADISNELIEL